MSYLGYSRPGRQPIRVMPYAQGSASGLACLSPPWWPRREPDDVLPMGNPTRDADAPAMSIIPVPARCVISATMYLRPKRLRRDRRPAPARCIPILSDAPRVWDLPNWPRCPCIPADVQGLSWRGRVTRRPSPRLPPAARDAPCPDPRTRTGRPGVPGTAPTADGSSPAGSRA